MNVYFDHAATTSTSAAARAAALRAMEECGLVTRTVFPEVPPHVEYELTELGHSLKPVLDSMQEWGAGYKRAIG